MKGDETCWRWNDEKKERVIVVDLEWIEWTEEVGAMQEQVWLKNVLPEVWCLSTGLPISECSSSLTWIESTLVTRKQQ